MTTAYTDGACSGNPGPGGWAWAVPGGRYASGAEAQSTNQRMEIMAALDAVRTLTGPLEIVSDSTYVVNCFRNKWWPNWIKKGWVNAAKKPVANRDLWEPLIDLYRQRGGEGGEITFRWVKGHSGDAMNDLVDRLAVEAAGTQRSRTGDEPPTELGPADEPRKRKAASSTAGAGASKTATPLTVAEEARALPGYPVVVLGHKPTELGGYGDTNPVALAVKGRLHDILVAKAQIERNLTVVSGLRLGAEMLGAEAAVEAGLPLVVVLPYPDPQSVWPAASQARFSALVDQAAEVVVLQKRVPATKQQAGAALARRDAWLARNVDEAVLVWDRNDPVLKRLAATLEDRLGDDVWVVDPTEFALSER